MITARALYAELEAERTRLNANMETARAAFRSSQRDKDHKAFVTARMDVQRINETLRAAAAAFTRLHNAAK